MIRLAIGLTAALVIHVLLLMAVLPEHQIVAPEVKGSGHVTVSIAPHQAFIPESIEESAEEMNPVEPPEDTVSVKEDIEQVPLPVQVLPAQKPEAMKETAQPGKRAAEKARVEKETRKLMPLKPVPEKVSAQVDIYPSSGGVTDFSAEESLRQPKSLVAVNRPPQYPPLARKRGWQGTVLLEAEVLSDGMVRSVRVKESSSFELLDKEALRAVRKWRFSPGERAGEPVPMKVLVPVHFLLQDN